MMGVLFPVGLFVAVFLIWFLFRSGGYKRQLWTRRPEETGISPASGSSIPNRAR